MLLNLQRLKVSLARGGDPMPHADRICRPSRHKLASLSRIETVSFSIELWVNRNGRLQMGLCLQEGYLDGRVFRIQRQFHAELIPRLTPVVTPGQYLDQRVVQSGPVGARRDALLQRGC